MREVVLPPVPDDTVAGLLPKFIPGKKKTVPQSKVMAAEMAEVEANMSKGKGTKPVAQQAVKRATATKVAKKNTAKKTATKKPAAAKVPEVTITTKTAPTPVKIKRGPQAVTAAKKKPSARPIRTYDKGISEILAEINEIENFSDRVEALKATGPNIALNDILVLAFNPTIEFALPEAIPNYTPSDPENHPAHLRTESKMFKYFIKNTPEGRGIKPLKRESMFIQLLEGIHPDDANLLAHIVAGYWLYPNIDEDVVRAAKPGLVPG